MVEIDKLRDIALNKDANFDEIDDEIVGFQRVKVENLSTEDNKKLTVKQKIAKELTYLTEAMGLDESA